MTTEQSDGKAYGSIADSSVHDHSVYLYHSEEVKDGLGGSDSHSGDVSDYIEPSRQLDVWDMGLEWYGISYEDTNRALRLITYEGYGYSPLSYYVACACWSRCVYPEDFGGNNLYQTFGGADTSYDEWMDSLGIADYAYVALEQCYREPEYIRYVNGVTTPSDYIYCEWDGSYWIYVWN